MVLEVLVHLLDLLKLAGHFCLFVLRTSMCLFLAQNAHKSPCMRTLVLHLLELVKFFVAMLLPVKHLVVIQLAVVVARTPLVMILVALDVLALFLLPGNLTILMSLLLILLPMLV